MNSTITEQKAPERTVNERSIQTRHYISIAKKNARPGIFESLGSFDSQKNEAELFSDNRYRRLINLLIYRSQL